jgi:glyoxylase-like metal-dependent hydrolase (beta-lactamase superfamily II)
MQDGIGAGGLIETAGIRCRILVDGWQKVSPRFVFKGYDDDVQGPFVTPYLDADGKLTGRLSALLVESGDELLLVDAGLGNSGASVDAGHVLDELTALDIRPWDIRTVLITHGHADHVGGLLDPRGHLQFGEARHVIHRDEAAFWASEDAGRLPDDAGAPALAALAALLDADLLDRIAGDVEIVPGVRAIEAPGHTPGHLALMIGDDLLWAGDAFVAMLNARHPGWVSAADMDGPTNEETRRSLLARAADEGRVLAATHMPDALRVVRDGDGYVGRSVGSLG